MIFRRPRSRIDPAITTSHLRANPSSDDIDALADNAAQIREETTGTVDRHSFNEKKNLGKSFVLSIFLNKNRWKISSLILISGWIFALITLQLHAYIVEYQGPLDHVTTSLQKPYYGMFCPTFSSEKSRSHSAETKNSETITSWNCNNILGGTGIIISENKTLGFPRIFMIGARDEESDTFASWRDLLSYNNGVEGENTVANSNNPSDGPTLQRINTLRISNQYARSGGALRPSSPSTAKNATNGNQQFLCRKMKWEQRLFVVYQSVFQKILHQYPDDEGFVIIEDDAILKSPKIFAEEVCNVHRWRMIFYSLFRSPLQLKRAWGRSPSCIYRHGTVAFYIRRPMMEKIVKERRRSLFCRFPIDMYISKSGPWYASRREVVGHLDSGRIGS
eukprot:CAMPEP_0171395940 /NCGR_PEP_ID=MMETSP0880-20121228/4291_1 /TAXON_ID=67004 /ORGANISM="Thalassiosira weissflogii, Strain CCMP1336" /LENGTH=390 /DNA_ID=CAMNT_0011909509 /DNA_START=109 /DNA_END=1278 /DNA_ORIENTATION=-